MSVSVVEEKTTNADIVLHSVPPNAAPVSPFNPRPAQDSMVDPSEPLVFTWMCADPDNDSIKYSVFMGTSPTLNETDIHVSGLTKPEYKRSDLLPGTTYYWKVRASDTKGNSTTGPVWNFSIKAEQENALACDGNASYVTVPHSAELSLSSGSFTLECWVKCTNISGMFPTLISKDNTNSNLDYCLQVAPEGVFRFLTRNLSNDVFGSTGIIPGTWYHVAAVVDIGVRRASLYVNGTLESYVNLSGGAVSSTAPLLIGTRINDASGGQPLGTHEGEIDEIRIWNIARSQAQIRSAMSTVLSPPISGLIAYWKANESGGSNLRDDSGHGH
ncbi:MAG: LamG-like jellyroll fold domain-containing protein, partial [Candidatus Kapaibacterium sp.]